MENTLLPLVFSFHVLFLISFPLGYFPKQLLVETYGSLVRYSQAHGRHAAKKQKNNLGM